MGLGWSHWNQHRMDNSKQVDLPISQIYGLKENLDYTFRVKGRQTEECLLLLLIWAVCKISFLKSLFGYRELKHTVKFSEVSAYNQHVHKPLHANREGCLPWLRAPESWFRGSRSSSQVLIWRDTTHCCLLAKRLSGLLIPTKTKEGREKASMKKGYKQAEERDV